MLVSSSCWVQKCGSVWLAFLGRTRKAHKLPKIIKYESFHAWKPDTMVTSRIKTQKTGFVLQAYILNYCGDDIPTICGKEDWVHVRGGELLATTNGQRWPKTICSVLTPLSVILKYASRLKIPCPLSTPVEYNGETSTPVYASLRIESRYTPLGRKADTNMRHYRNELGYCKRGSKMSNKWASVDKYDRHKIIKNDENEMYDGDQ